MSERLKITTFGGLKLLLDDRPVVGLTSHKAQALLVYLACNPRAYAREVLAELLWDERSQSQALGNLRVVLTSLRKQLKAYVVVSRESVFLNPDADLWLDVSELEAAIEHWVMAGKAVTPEIAARFASAVELYQGEFLEGFYLREASGFDAWLMRERQRLHYKVLDALGSLIAYELQSGAYPAGIEHARRLLELDPLMESAQRQLMRLMNYSGQRAAALEVYERFQNLLAEELGIAPEAESQALYAQIQAGELERPVLRETAEHPHNLPVQLTSLIGRQSELVEVGRLLIGDQSGRSRPKRLVTLVGVGGCGKTRLAIQAASEVLHAYPQGAWLVELAPLSDPLLVPQAALKALDLQAKSERPALEALADFLRPRQLLLVVDNCEHLIEACAQLIERLLRTCPHLNVLATSRERLDVPGEAVFYVPSLSTPEADQAMNVEKVSQYEAVQLFVERAAATLPGFVVTDENASAIAKVCRRLDGIPLAIELAAARLNVLTVAGIAARLDDSFRLLTGGSRTALPRHQTLRAAIDWSYALLSQKERIQLRRLAVFEGGWSLEAAEAICAGEEIEACEVLGLLSSLVNKSLVIAKRTPHDEVRYTMLETIRQYGREKLLAANEGDWASRQHLDYFLNFAERADRELRGSQSLAWTHRVKLEYDNLRAALEWSLGACQAVKPGVRLANALFWIWDRLGYWFEARFWLEESLAQMQTLDRTAARAKALQNYGLITFDIQGNQAKGQLLLEESLEIWRELSPSHLPDYAYSLVWLGSLLCRQGDYKTGRDYLEQGRDIFQEAGERWGQAYALKLLASFLRSTGDEETACDLVEEEVELFRETGDRWGLAISLNDLGLISIEQGNYLAANRHLEESLEIFREFGSTAWVGGVLNNLGETARCLNDYDRAQGFYLECLSSDQKSGISNYGGICLNLGYVALYQGDDAEAVARFKEALTLSKEADNKLDTVLCLAGLAAAAAARGQAEGATRLYGAVAAQLEELQVGQATSMIFLSDRLEFERYQGRCRAQLEQEEYEAAWEQGRKMELDQAIGFAFRALGLRE
jgi:predicted ATPase/DNA-binding SARP family transcriptional activator